MWGRGGGDRWPPRLSQIEGKIEVDVLAGAAGREYLSFLYHRNCFSSMRAAGGTENETKVKFKYIAYAVNPALFLPGIDFNFHFPRPGVNKWL